MNELKIDFQWNTFNSDSNIEEWNGRGLLDGVIVTTPDNKKFNLNFMVPDFMKSQIRHFLEKNEFNNIPYFDIGCNQIIIPEINEEIVTNTINEIYRRGNFKEPIFIESKD